MKYTKKLFVYSTILAFGIGLAFSDIKVGAMFGNLESCKLESQMKSSMKCKPGKLRKSPCIDSFKNIGEEENKLFCGMLVDSSVVGKEVTSTFTRVFEFSPEIIESSKIARDLCSFSRCFSCTIGL